MINRFFAGLCVLALVGCASVDTARLPPTEPAVVSPTFSLAGRISVRVGDRLDTGKMTWRRELASESIALYSPFGSQMASLNKVGTKVRLQRQGETVESESIALLTAQFLGVALDLDAIAHWTQAHSLNIDAQTNVTLPDGSVWQVTVDGLERRGPYQFARKLTALHGDTVVKLVIDEWNAP